MSICVSVKVGEGLVLAADSASTIEGQIGNNPPGILKTYEHARKLCQVKDYPVGVMSWGAGVLGARTMESLVAEFANNRPRLSELDSLSVKVLSDELYDFIKQRHLEEFPQAPTQPQGPGALGIYVGGFSTDAFFPETYVGLLPIEAELHNARPDREEGKPTFGANWYGQTDAIIRWHLGFAPELRGALLSQKEWTEPEVREFLQGFQYPVLFDGMPLQDAVELAEFLVYLVIQRFRFVVGAPLCGGAIEVAVLTPGRFTWVRRRDLHAGNHR